MTKPPTQILSEIFSVDFDSGTLFWKLRGPEFTTRGFMKERGRLVFNAQFSGKEALTAIDGNGYKGGAIFGRKFKAHHVIWAMSTGRWPDQIDHINHNRSDNRICNLREVTSAENSRNASPQKNNKSGITGVGWHKKRRKWIARITISGKTIHLGEFTALAEAAKARSRANVKYGFHKNHGITSTPKR